MRSFSVTLFLLVTLWYSPVFPNEAVPFSQFTHPDPELARGLDPILEIARNKGFRVLLTGPLVFELAERIQGRTLSATTSPLPFYFSLRQGFNNAPLGWDGYSDLDLTRLDHEADYPIIASTEEYYLLLSFETEEWVATLSSALAHFSKGEPVVPSPSWRNLGDKTLATIEWVQHLQPTRFDKKVSDFLDPVIKDLQISKMHDFLGDIYLSVADPAAFYRWVSQTPYLCDNDGKCLPPILTLETLPSAMTDNHPLQLVQRTNGGLRQSNGLDNAFLNYIGYKISEIPEELRNRLGFAHKVAFFHRTHQRRVADSIRKGHGFISMGKSSSFGGAASWGEGFYLSASPGLGLYGSEVVQVDISPEAVIGRDIDLFVGQSDGLIAVAKNNRFLEYHPDLNQTVFADAVRRIPSLDNLQRISALQALPELSANHMLNAISGGRVPFLFAWYLSQRLPENFAPELRGELEEDLVELAKYPEWHDLQTTRAATVLARDPRYQNENLSRLLTPQTETSVPNDMSRRKRMLKLRSMSDLAGQNIYKMTFEYLDRTTVLQSEDLVADTSRLSVRQKIALLEEGFDVFEKWMNIREDLRQKYPVLSEETYRANDSKHKHEFAAYCLRLSSAILVDLEAADDAGFSSLIDIAALKLATSQATPWSVESAQRRLKEYYSPGVMPQEVKDTLVILLLLNHLEGGMSLEAEMMIHAWANQSFELGKMRPIQKAKLSLVRALFFVRTNEWPENISRVERAAAYRLSVAKKAHEFSFSSSELQNLGREWPDSGLILQIKKLLDRHLNGRSCSEILKGMSELPSNDR